LSNAVAKIPTDVKTISKYDFHYLWYDKKWFNEFANVLYNKIINLSEEGIETRFHKN
jgi:hypothetical protein